MSTTSVWTVFGLELDAGAQIPVRGTITTVRPYSRKHPEKFPVLGDSIDGFRRFQGPWVIAEITRTDFPGETLRVAFPASQLVLKHPGDWIAIGVTVAGLVNHGTIVIQQGSTMYYPM